MEAYKKYLDESLDFTERAEDLVSRMTLQECALQLLHPAGGVPRLGVPDYNWWNEALHGVARSGLATVFPQTIGMAASFDDELLHEVADLASTEARGKYNEYQKEGDHGIYKGLTFWTPNINIFRDPRWGRGQETYGEDPYLTERMGLAFMKGLQGDDPRYLKSAACAKHFAVHSGPENLRHEFDAKASPRDMEETYLPAFEALAKAGVAGFMGAYNRTNGEPCCGSETLLRKTLREKWGFKGYVTSDCWAIFDFHAHHKVTDNPLESVKLALENTCDLNCGQVYEFVQMAVEKGYVSEETVRESAVRLMTIRMRLGMFDQKTPWDELSYDDVDTEEARELNLRMAHESIVLLKNDGILPLNPEKLHCVTVCGPNAASIRVLEGNYHGKANAYVSVLQGIREALPGVKVLYSEGSDLRENDGNGKQDCLAEVAIMARRSDLLIVVTGLDETIEGEEGDAVGDKSDLLLPACQRELVKAALATNKPVVLINMTGSAMDFAEADEGAAAILQAWYPGAFGGKAVADILLGKVSPSGKLPLTFYRESTELPEFTDYNMTERTYKYFTGEPLYPFGYGLSYAKFDFSNLHVSEPDAAPTRASLNAGTGVPVSVTVKNESAVSSDTVVEFYVRDQEASVPNPKYRLAGFRHVHVPAGESVEVKELLPAKAFSCISDDGERFYEAGAFTVYAGASQPDAYSEKLSGETCTALELICE